MKEPDAGPETGTPEWSRPQRASEPLPAPPSGYKFGGPDYLYAPRPDGDDEDPAAAPAPELPAAVPAMVWSAARSTWEPAGSPTPTGSPAALPPAPPASFQPPQPPPNWPRQASKSSPRRRSVTKRLAAILIGIVLFSRFVASMGSTSSGGSYAPPLAGPLPAITAEPSPVPLPSANVPVPVTPPAVATSLADLLGAQIAAVRSGNQAWFLGTVDPQATAAVATYKRLFANLRGLRATGFAESLGSSSDPVDQASSRVTVAFCIGGTMTPCALASADLDVKIASHGKGVLIESVAPAPETSRRSAPWMATALTVTVKDNVLIAATPTTKAQVATVLPLADIAAGRADQYAPTLPAPRPYVLYLAGQADVTAWFGTFGQISFGVVDSPVGYDQVVVALPEARQTGPKGGDGLAADLQRALAFMSLTRNSTAPVPLDTFSAGLRAYAAYDGLTGADADTLAPVADYVHNGDWNSSCYYTSDDASTQGMDAMAGMGLLAIRYLVEEFTLETVLTFWYDVDQLGESPDDASLELFHLTWSDADVDCANYVDSASGP